MISSSEVTGMGVGATFRFRSILCLFGLCEKGPRLFKDFQMDFPLRKKGKSTKMKGFSRYEPNKPIEYYEEQYHVMESLKAEAIASLAQANASLNAADMFEWAVDK